MEGTPYAAQSSRTQTEKPRYPARRRQRDIVVSILIFFVALIFGPAAPPPSRYRLSDAKSPDTFLRRCLEGLRMYSAGCGVKKCPTKNWLSDLTSKGIRLHRRRSKTLFRPIKHTVAPKPRINRCNPFLPSLPQLVGLEVCRSVGI